MSADDEAAGEAKAAKDRRTRTIEIIEVAVLSIVAIATAWSGYQGTKWGGRQSMLYAQASSIRLQADETGTRAGQVLVADATIFTAWLQAHHAGDRPRSMGRDELSPRGKRCRRRGRRPISWDS